MITVEKTVNSQVGIQNMDSGEEIFIKLREKYGDPYRTKISNKTEKICGFNERFWAALLKEEILIVYEPDIKVFWKYDSKNGLFVRITSEAIRELAGERIFQAAKDENLPEIRKLVSVPQMDLIVKALVGISEQRDFFKNRPHAIHLANGMVFEDESKMVFKEGFSFSFRSRNQSPYAFIREAECNRFHNELLIPMLPDEDDRLVFQKCLGIFLSGDNPTQKILLLDGTPGRGKGVLQRVVTGLVGRQNTTELRTSQLVQRFETNRYIGKSLLTASDVPGDFLMYKSASVLKSLVGGDYLDSEAKHGNEAHELTGDFNIMIVSNTRLRCRLDGDAGAWRRRLIILRTNSPQVEKKIPNFEEILLSEEGDGILQWTLEGYRLALQDISEIGDLILSDNQIKRVEGLLAESNALEIYVRDHIVRCSGYAITVEDILTSFADFCANRGWQISPQTILQRELSDLMLRHHRVSKSNNVKTTNSGAKRGFRGVRIKEQDETIH